MTGINRAKHIAAVMQVLEQAKLRHAMNKPWIMAVTLALCCPLFWYVIAPDLGNKLPQARLVSIIAVAVLAVVIAIWETRRLAAYERILIGAFDQSGILQRIALGWDQLPDIHRYTPWPWRYFLGARPSKLAGWVKLLTYNLDWYLFDPRPLIRTQWMAYALAGCVLLTQILIKMYLK